MRLSHISISFSLIKMYEIISQIAFSIHWVNTIISSLLCEDGARPPLYWCVDGCQFSNSLVATAKISVTQCLLFTCSKIQNAPHKWKIVCSLSQTQSLITSSPESCLLQSDPRRRRARLMLSLLIANRSSGKFPKSLEFCPKTTPPPPAN